MEPQRFGRYEIGYLYSYNYEKRSAAPLDPLGTKCCYSDAQWSPDGSHILFSYQSSSSGENAKTQLYYVLYGTIGTGATYQPYKLPAEFFANPQDHFEAALRPAKP